MEMAVPVSGGKNPSENPFRAAEEVLRRCIQTKVFPGAAACAGTSALMAWETGLGRLDYGAGGPVGPETLYDLASLTKVVSTTSLILRLVDAERLALATPVKDILPEFTGGQKEAVTIEHLLTHSSGLPSWRPLFKEAGSREEAMALVLATPLESLPGAAERYSDLGAILLGECAARAAGMPLAVLAWKLVFDPLGLRDTCFRPSATDLWRTAPTEVDRSWRGRLIQGEVHDENASALGGVAGHAGLFSTAEDLGRFSRELLRAIRGEGGSGSSIFRSESARRFTTRRNLVPGSSRALGWDTRSDGADGTGPPGDRSSSGRKFGRKSFGHTGFTGTSIWIDPENDRFAVLLTNNIHPARGTGGMMDARRDVHDAVADALDGLRDGAR